MGGVHGLALIALLAFVSGFWGARVFAVLTGIVVAPPGSGMHFHHLLYGMGMMGLAGWMGIARKLGRFDRVFALTFGLGAGVAGDEVGNVLLGFYPYPSPVSDLFFFAAVSFSLIALLIIKVFEAHRIPYASGRVHLLDGQVHFFPGSSSYIHLSAFSKRTVKQWRD